MSGSNSERRYVRADQIDLKSLDEQLDRHLIRVLTFEKKQKQQQQQQEWEIDSSKLIIKSFIARGTFGTVHRGVYDDQDVAVKLLDWGEQGHRTEAEVGNEEISNPKDRCGAARVERLFLPAPLLNSLGESNYSSVVLTPLSIFRSSNFPSEVLAAGRGSCHLKLRAAFSREVAVWHKLDHPNVTKFIGATKGVLDLNIQTESGEIGQHRNVCCVVVEYLPGGALKSFLIKNRRRKLAFKLVIQLALDLARGLSYLHSRKIVHRDVKTENMLLDKTRTLKIADFGVARVEASNPNDMTGETGALGYMAPEVLNGNAYNRKCDVYSFGICLWEIYCCDMPYPSLSFSEVTSAVVCQNLRPEVPRCCPSSLGNVMKRCWDANPNKRPEMDEVVAMLEAIDTSRGGGMIPPDQQKGCFLFRRKRGP